MGGANCAIVGCSACRSRHRGLSFHRLPNDEKWRNEMLKIIRSSRSDPVNPKNLAVCSRHFEPDCFVYKDADGHKRKSVLKKGSLPTLNLPKKSVETKKVNPRKPPAVRNVQSNINLKHQHISDRPTEYFHSLLSRTEIQKELTPDWICSELESTKIQLENHGAALQLCIDSLLTVQVWQNNFLLPQTFKINQSLSSFLNQVENFNFCNGISDPVLQKYSHIEPTNNHFRHVTLEMTKPGVIHYKSTIRSTNCTGICKPNKTLCVNCSYIKNTINAKYRRSNKNNNSTTRVISSKTPLQKISKGVLAKAIKESRRKIKHLNKELSVINKRIQRESVVINSDLHNDLKTIMDSQDLEDPFIRLFWKEQSKAFSKKDRGHKWHPMMIRLAILIHAESPSAYKSIKETGIIKLPGESTLRDYTNYVKPAPGFQNEVLQDIKEAAQDLPENHRWVTILVDEMSIKSDLVFDKSSGNVVGFINNFNEGKDIKENIATHCLVYMIVGVTSTLKFTLGWFPVRSSNASDIYPGFWEAVGHLESFCELKVIAATADKASCNMRFFGLHGTDNPVYKTMNLFAPDRNIYFFSDAPHLLKTIRNNISSSGDNQNTKYLWNNGRNILWSHIKDVYHKDMENELSRATKLTYDHIYLTSYSVMKVNYAAQVLSRSVGIIMKEFGGDSAQETARLILLVNRFFDCLNVRSLYEGKNKKNADLDPFTSLNDTRFSFLLDEFLGYIENWKKLVDSREGYSKAEKAKMFLSVQTYNGLLITTKSVVEATKYLLSEGVNFVLTNKFCQDPLEEHFGRHRGLGRRNDNPNIYQFGYQENKLRLQRSLCLMIKPKGNIKRKRKEAIVIDETPLKKRRSQKL